MVLALTMLVATPPASSTAQADHTEQTDPLLRRWVGHYRNRPIFFDFFSDSLLVVNDIHAVDFVFTWDSIIAYGDTSFAVSASANVTSRPASTRRPPPSMSASVV